MSQTAKKSPSNEGKKSTLKVERNKATVEDRISKVQKLNLLIDKRKKARAKLDEVETFKYSTDNSQVAVALRDEQREQFTINNSVMVTEILNLLQDKMTAFIQETDKEIQAFEV
jgi:hypothetical protein